MSDMPILSQSTKELLGKVRMIVPPMLEKFYKGTLPFLKRCGPLSDKSFKDNWAEWLS
jgi:hypothetical protein